MLIALPNRSDRQRLRALQIRRLGPKRLRRPQQPLVCRTSYLLRAFTRDRLPGSLLPAEQRRGLCAWRLLQFHPSEGAKSGAGA